ncbi:MAG TPA: SpoIIE family protein phosphatase [Solirubrobacterales bacterium]|nr:SpoIIE family protein phosphatase [Solirubrobacterales bacterium]
MPAELTPPPAELPIESAGEHFAAIVESSDDAIMSKDAEGKILSWNAGASRIYGYTPEEAIGQPISMLIPSHRAGEERRILDEVLAGRRVDHYETERVTKDGRQIIVSLTVSPIRNPEGRIFAASVIARDVTGVHRSRELAHRLQEATTALARELSEEAVVRVILAQAVPALGADAGAIGFVEGEEIVLVGTAGHTPDELAGWDRFPLTAEVPMAHAARTGDAVWMHSTEDFAVRFPDLGDTPLPYASLAALPLASGGLPFGAIALSFGRSGPFDPEERAFLTAATQHAADALTRARSFESQRQAAERDRFLSEAGELLTRSLDPETTLRQVAELAINHVANWCLVDLVDEDGALRSVAVAHIDPDRVPLVARLRAEHPPDPQGAVGSPRVIRSGRSEVYADAPVELVAPPDAAREQLEAVRELGLGSAMVVPLQARSRVLGAITLIASGAGRRYDSSDLRLAEDLARRAALAFDNAMLFRREHEAALTLQRSLLPASLPEVSGVDFSARYRPATAELEVGGDWYDVVALDDGTVTMTIGDVAGRGIRAASVMGRIRPALRAYVHEGHRPEQALARLDRMMREFDRPQMATVFHLHYDPSRRTATYVRAGHPPALVRKPDGEVVELGGRGTPPLGIVEEIEYHEHTVEIPPGSVALLYTDGLIERRETDLVEGLDRLKRALSESPAGARECLDWLDATLSASAVPDDVAMLAMSVRG